MGLLRRDADPHDQRDLRAVRRRARDGPGVLPDLRGRVRAGVGAGGLRPIRGGCGGPPSSPPSPVAMGFTRALARKGTVMPRLSAPELRRLKVEKKDEWKRLATEYGDTPTEEQSGQLDGLFSQFMEGGSIAQENEQAEEID